MTLEEAYRGRREQVLKPIAAALEAHVIELFKDEPRIDRIKARAKQVDSFMKKSENLDEEGQKKYAEPLEQIQDQVGVRIVTFYLSDVERLDKAVLNYFRAVEFRAIVPESEWEFGYFGRHYILVIPPDVIEEAMDKDMVPPFSSSSLKPYFSTHGPKRNTTSATSRVSGS
ncbi:MAG: RelA/SpoT domain-containing protein [Alphaproteobacteria bacterium]|nr:RelA/SpoT domain-containing protein [Alphaproteobacteria bacterium]MBV9965684.1 RelA/SpoT domain-containing protein [Alphaproteobacteria bacterium]